MRRPVSFAVLALPAIDALRGHDRRAFDQAVRWLEETPVEDWPARPGYQPTSDESVHVFQLLGPLQVIVRVLPKAIEVQELVRLAGRLSSEPLRQPPKEFPGRTL
jgi:hypothetical protein